MSLKHILNDDPAPPPHISTPAVHSTMSTSSADTAPARQSPPAATMSPSPQTQHYAPVQAPRDLDQPMSSRGIAYQPAPSQEAGGWDPHTGQWRYHDVSPMQLGGDPYQDHDGSQSPTLSNGSQSTRFRDGLADSHGRKKRKVADDDEDYQPPGQKRVRPKPVRRRH